MTDDKLLSDVRDWLENGGYVLEMRVAREVSKRTNIYWQGYSYDDPETGKRREADVGGFLILREYDRHLHGIRLIIECKQTDAPWVVFKGTTGGNGAVSPFDCFDKECPACSDLEEDYGDFMRGIPDAYAVTQKHDQRKQGFDLAYEAVQQAANVFLADGPDAPADRPEEGHPDPVRGTGISIPIVVTTSPLVLVSLDDKGEVALERVERVVVQVARTGLGDADCIDVIVVTESEFPAVLDELCLIGEEFPEAQAPAEPAT